VAAPGMWKVSASRHVIVDCGSPVRYRITNATGNKKGVEIIVDSKTRNQRLMPGLSIDIEGQKIEINQPEGTASEGTYDVVG